MAPDELREDPLFTVRGRCAGVEHAQVWIVLRIDVREQQAFSLAAAMTDAEFRERCFPALVVIVQVYQEGVVTLALHADLLLVVRQARIDEIVMGSDLLT